MKRAIFLVVLLFNVRVWGQTPLTGSTPSTSSGQAGSSGFAKATPDRPQACSTPSSVSLPAQGFPLRPAGFHLGQDFGGQAEGQAWQAEWNSVEKTLGRSGEVQGQGIQILFPRTDLNVVVQGFPLDSSSVLVSRFAFEPGPEGASKKDRLEGQVYLLDTEVTPAMVQVAKGGLEITALYSPFLDESPCLKCLRFKGEGSRSSLAWAAKMVLSATGTPLALPSPSPTGSPTAVVTPVVGQNAWGNVQNLLGPGEEKGPTLLYQWEGNDREASLAFQNHGQETTAVGELGLAEGESKRLVEEFLKRHITVTAIFCGDSGEPSRSFVDFWAVGDRKKLAEDLKEILDQEGLLSP